MAHVLVVDDNELMRRLVTLALRAAGHDVVTAVNGRDALAQLEELPCVLVVTDLLMPEMDGLELIATLRKTRPNLPVIAMSGGSPKSHACLDRARELGAVAAIPKPFKTRELVDAVNQVLERVGR